MPIKMVSVLPSFVHVDNRSHSGQLIKFLNVKFFPKWSFIYAKNCIAFQSILLALLTQEALLYRKLKNSKHPPVSKKFTSVGYLLLLDKVQRKKLDNKWQHDFVEYQNQASSGLQQFNFKMQLFQDPINWCNLGH